MPTVGDVLEALERLAPKRYALGFDRIGLQVGDPSAEVTRCVVSLDRSLGAVEFAAARDAQMLVSHHPLIFEPLASVTESTLEGRTVLALARAGISLAAAHTNWDSALGGVSDALATLLGLTDVRAFGMCSATGEQPICRVGRLPVPVSLFDLRAVADATLETQTWAWGDPTATISRLAVAGGAADSDWPAAKTAGADAFLVGEVKQHIALEATSAGMAILAAGHYATEHPGAAALARRLEAELPEIEFLLFTPPPGSHGRPL